MNPDPWTRDPGPWTVDPVSLQSGRLGTLKVSAKVLLYYFFWDAALAVTRLCGKVGELREIVYFIAEQPAPAPQLAHPEGCAALRIVLVTVPGTPT